MEAGVPERQPLNYRVGVLSQLHLWQGKGLEIKLSPVASGSIIHAYVVKLQRNLWTLRLE